MSQPEPASDADFTVSMPESWRPKLTQSEPTLPDPPDERIAVIEDSLQCFTFGWLSCLPVIGVAWLYPTVRRFRQARRRQVQWNPARGYLAAGLALASVGWLINVWSWLTAFAAIAVEEAQNADGLNLGGALLAATLFNSPILITGLCVAMATAFPRFADLLRWERFVASMRKRRVWFVALACAWVVLPFWFQLRLLSETYAFLAPMIAWSFWMLSGVGCLILQRLDGAGKSLAWLAWIVWLIGAWLLAPSLTAE